MLTLGFDTATDWGCLGLFRDGRLLAETGWWAGRNQAAQFLPVLDGLLRRLGLAPSAIDLLAVGCGPGSYTGLRIGLAMAEALSFALERPLTGVSTLAVLAENGAGFPGFVCPAIPARRGEVYAALYREGEEVMPAAPYRPADLAAALAPAAKDPVLLLGGGSEAVAASPAARPLRLVLGFPEQNLPRGGVVARLGAGRPLSPARPLYLRRTEAEERLEEAGGECR